VLIWRHRPGTDEPAEVPMMDAGYAEEIAAPTIVERKPIVRNSTVKKSSPKRKTTARSASKAVAKKPVVRKPAVKNTAK